MTTNEDQTGTDLDLDKLKPSDMLQLIVNDGYLSETNAHRARTVLARRAQPAGTGELADDDAFIVEAVERAKIHCVHPTAATTRDIGRAVLAAYRATLTHPSVSAGQPDEVYGAEFYTCIDKGGEYELLGDAYGAGPAKGTAVTVYRDTTTNSLFYRSVDDFGKRMRQVGSFTQQPRAATNEQLPAAVRAAERIDAMHKGLVDVFAAIKAESLASAAPSVQPAGAPAQAQPDLQRKALLAAQDALGWAGTTGDRRKAIDLITAALSASPSAPAVQAEPVYQVDLENGGCWMDIEAADVSGWEKRKFKVRTLYTGAAPAGVDVSVINYGNPVDKSGAAQTTTASASGGQVGCERDDGLLNIHAESESCEVCAPAPSRSAAPAEGRLIPDAECKQGSCMRMTTGCHGKCSLSGLDVPIIVSGGAAPAGGEDARDAARYRVLRHHVAPRDVSISMTVPVADIPPDQTIEERIDMLCDIAINRAALSTMQQSTDAGGADAKG